MPIRSIQPRDNTEMASIIRTVLTEFGANRPGFAWQDPELDSLYEAYDCPGRTYQIVQVGGQLAGGAGIAEFACEMSACCELQKMYLLPEYRGHGHGEKLISCLLDAARKMGYGYCYLETLSSMSRAAELYRKSGFNKLGRPLGNSGHNACDEWYLLAL